MKKKKYFYIKLCFITVTLLLATLIGIYYAYKDRKRKTVKNYYYGGKNLSPVSWNHQKYLKKWYI